MPRTDLLASPELAIQLSQDQRVFGPGDTIIGNVVRKVHTVSPRAWVTVRLRGRAKTKMIVHRRRGNASSTNHYRGRFNFFGPNETCQKLFDGPVHIPPNGDPQVWAFALAIPMRPSFRSVREENDQDNSYLPLTEEAIGASFLPFSFGFENHNWGHQFHGYVEYHLEAQLWLENKSSASIATLPIFIRPVSTAYPLMDFDLKSRTYPGIIKTQRLVPGMGDAELSFRQKTQKLFGSSKVPQFSFSIQVGCPAVIQLQSPVPIPFKIRIIPDPKRTSGIIADVPQNVMLSSLEIELVASTSVICKGLFSTHSANATQKFDFGIRGIDLNRIAQGPVIIPSGSNVQALDVGDLLGLSLNPLHASTRGKPLARFVDQVYPSFVTYNIRHNHLLRWQLSLKVASEKMSLSGELPVSIIPPS
ncbi:hypothetical protein F5884DRAFT_785757 [Xylogone sp. PMI_703]|nr:hypothetical protein F5884DRAFT_785757 [Xylogone sp. PMI_703]